MSLEIPGLVLTGFQTMVGAGQDVRAPRFTMRHLRKESTSFFNAVCLAAARTSTDPEKRNVAQTRFTAGGAELTLNCNIYTPEEAELIRNEITSAEYWKQIPFPSGEFNEFLDLAFLAVCPGYQFVDLGNDPPCGATDSFTFSEIAAEALEQMNLTDSMGKLIKLWADGLKKARNQDSLSEFKKEYSIAMLPGSFKMVIETSGKHWRAFVSSTHQTKENGSAKELLCLTIEFKLT